MKLTARTTLPKTSKVKLEIDTFLQQTFVCTSNLADNLADCQLLKLLSTCFYGNA